MAAPSKASRARKAPQRAPSSRRGAPRGGAAEQSERGELRALVAALGPTLAAQEASATTRPALVAAAALRQVLELVQRCAVDPDGYTLTLVHSHLGAGVEGDGCGLLLTRD